MSKLINIPGTTSFIPADDIVGVKIHARMVTKSTVIFPETSEDNFQILAAPYAEFTLVTTYVDEVELNNAKLAVEEEEEEPLSKKKRRAEDEESESNTENYKTVEKICEISPLTEETNQLLLGLEDYAYYQGLPLKIKENLSQRFTNYKQYLDYQAKRDELLQITQNLNTSPTLPTNPVDTMTGNGSRVVVEEEDESTNTGQAFQANFDPNSAKLREVSEWLTENQESNEKRIAYIKKHLGSEKSSFESTDAYKFIEILKETNLNEEKLDELNERVNELVERVATIVG